MRIDRVILGDFQTNCYVLRSDDAADRCVVVDAGLGAEELVESLTSKAWQPVAVVLTHGHIDHIAGVQQLRGAFPDLRLYVHRLDAAMLSDPRRNLSFLAGYPFRSAPADVQVEDGQRIVEAGVELEVLHVPGHTPGGICLYSPADAVIFTNDTLFAGSVGRTDLPGGSPDELSEAIGRRIMVLPDRTVVHPGHGPSTTIGQERLYNPFLR